jgi:hypothetical protein
MVWWSLAVNVLVALAGRIDTADGTRRERDEVHAHDRGGDLLGQRQLRPGGGESALQARPAMCRPDVA